MPTINEVWEEAQKINANLVTLHNDVDALESCCATTNQRINDLLAQATETNDWLQELRTLVQDGFTAMAAGFTGMHARQDVTNRLLLHQIEQQQTMICILENISRNTCGLLDQSAQQTELQTGMAADSTALHHMVASSHAEAALAYQRHLEDQRRLEACCPPEERQPACIYERCEAPEEIRVGELDKYRGYEGRASKVQRRKPARESDRGPR